MTQAPTFWDATALVPLCVNEAASRRAHAQLGRSEPVVWWFSIVEIQSAICRLHRERAVTERERRGAERRMQVLRDGWKEILPEDSILERALQLSAIHPLRAGDSLQLAAALAWCGERPAGRPFISGDRRLCVAARISGFTVVELT